jgi:hypothetical protein
MNQQSTSRFGLLLAVLAVLAFMAGLYAEEKPPLASKNATGTALPVKPKPLSENIKRGLAYLVSQQQPNGGWGQGGGWRMGEQGSRVEGANIADPPDVADTCMAALALLRAGNTPTEGLYAKNLAKAVEFICSHVEESDKSSLYVTSVRDTQVQQKIGPFVDTFLASLVLAEVKAKMPTGEKRLVAALDKTVGKIQSHQKEDGSFEGAAWAPIFSQGLASKALNRAKQNGATVTDKALARAETYAAATVDVAKGTFRSTPMGAAGGLIGGGSGRGTPALAAAGAMSLDAGVPLYSVSNQTAALQEAVNTNKNEEKKARETLGRKEATPDEKQKAQQTLDRVVKVEAAQKVAVQTVVQQAADPQFMRGFGSNGGEEFLSYLNISETLVVKGGEEWTKWDKSMTDNMNRIQNKDGSWSGDHCITGRTLCTAGALLVLMADRTPIPVAAKMQGRK